MNETLFYLSFGVIFTLMLFWPAKRLARKVIHLTPKRQKGIFHRPKWGTWETTPIRNQSFPCFKGTAEIRTCTICGVQVDRRIKYRIP